MSYRPPNNNNNNIRPQQTMMINPYQSPSHQTFPPYGPTSYYSSYPGTYYTENSMRHTSQGNIPSYINPIDSDSSSTIRKSPSCTSISSHVPDDVESSNSSFSDNLSMSNEKSLKKTKTCQSTPVDVFNQLRSMGNEQERNLFVDRLQKLWEEHHIICRKLPCLSRQTIDLYRFYTLIRDENGFEEFSKIAKTRHWCNIASKLNIPNCSTTAFNIKQQYIKLKLFHYECKYDREGIDPELILAKIDKQKNISPTVPISKPLSFPVNSIEPTNISNTKRRKLTSKDIPPVDLTKLLMSLRAGLLAETTWALDTINIMLTDDQTYTYFRLKQMPGLLQAIVDIYNKCLIELFDEFKIENEQIFDNSKNQQVEQDSIIYRIESNFLNKKPQDITYEQVYDDQGKIKDTPENILDLQNTDDLSYIQTHFDPLHMNEHNKNRPISSQIGYDQICSRCICLSSIIRNLSFISENDLELIKNQTLIDLLARLLLLRSDFNFHCLSDKKSFSWFECLINIRENTLVTLANISSILIFDKFNSNLINQLVDGLLYWSICSIENQEEISYLSVQRLSIEILTKLSINDMNIDFILITPPFSRIKSLLNILINWLSMDDINNIIHCQREFAIVLLNSLFRCDTNLIRNIENISYLISLLIKFLEDYEIKTNELILQYGLEYILRLINAEQVDEILFTTNEMLKRAVNCLLIIIMNSTDSIKILKKYEERILDLSISNVIHPNIGRILTDILHYC